MDCVRNKVDASWSNVAITHLVTCLSSFQNEPHVNHMTIALGCGFVLHQTLWVMKLRKSGKQIKVCSKLLQT